MKRLVSVSVFEFSTQWPSLAYITKDYMFNIKCTIVSSDMRILQDKYLLKLEGSEEDIQKFLDYLKYEGFKIK